MPSHPKILYFTKYSRNAGSSRLRSFQYFPYLEKAGFEVEVSPLFIENYLVQLYAGKSTLVEAVLGYGKRFLKLFTVGNYDTIVIEKELFPYLPSFAEYLLKLFGKKYIVDYDDAIFHNYDQSSNPLLKLFLSKKIDTVMKNAAVVVAGNSYLADRAKKAGAQKIEIIPTVIDLERYPFQVKKESEKFVIGWIGTKSTFEKHLLPQRNWIIKLQEDATIEFHIVGITEDMNLGKNVKYIPWTEETEVEHIRQFDMGIMPLQDSLWEKGKCSYKIIQYFACSIPAIASPVGMNNEVINEGENGFLVNGEKEWLEKIKYLKTNIEERNRMGQKGREEVEGKFSLQATSKKWKEILERTNK
ncbi:glycosyltransferase family 4 protein [Kaistella flava (ex Peng et al. 2021)]|uniref:Glycosyltransferase family 4 protein n=1 Tax=Kaistella flava (ex Peng et al. 2021) TaxID=2038776 RepID=A0A7M2Y957_9FLAO|nr:glycosyltransferase family 4 protein [Kaistella flava (ex Peng et al. 2021)]QOW10626.1 glycosyltransferase family 4 protein [Kaistella flava (ex Peng et al. 2021)]